MLAKKNRFQGRASLGLVFKRGAVTRGRLMSLKFQPTSRADLRAAIVVSRKVSKSAVVRNRIRRRIYALLEAELSKLQVGDLVVSCFASELATMPAAEFKKSLLELLAQAKIYQQSEAV